MVCSNDFHYVLKEDADAQDIKVCIATGAKVADMDRLKFPNDEFYMKSGDEMAELFSHIPGAMENTLAIADRCNVEFNFDEHHLPHFDVPEGETATTYYAICVKRSAATVRYDDAGTEERSIMNSPLSLKWVLTIISSSCGIMCVTLVSTTF